MNSYQQAIEEHHISHSPDVIIEIPRKEHQAIHNIEPNDSELSRVIRRYDKINQLIVAQKNWLTAFEKDFNEKPDIGIEHSIQLKKELTKEIHNLVKNDLEKIHIKGLGSRYLAGILAYAHPNRFKSLGKFLCYCGFTNTAHITKKYNRKVKGVVYLLSKSVIKCKNEKYYPMYKMFKESGLNHYKALNRLGTFILKEIYETFREVES